MLTRLIWIVCRLGIKLFLLFQSSESDGSWDNPSEDSDDSDDAPPDPESHAKNFMRLDNFIAECIR